MILNKHSASVYWWDKINIFHKYVVFRVLKLIFKLKNQNNYNNWWNEILTQIHFIKVKTILKNRQKSLFTNLFNNDFKIWYLKNTVVYNMLMTELKSDIHQNIKLQINNDEKNTAKLWITSKAEYRIYTSDFKFKLFNKFLSISINIYNTDIWNYIVNFHDIFEKLKTMKYKLNEWYVND